MKKIGVVAIDLLAVMCLAACSATPRAERAPAMIFADGAAAGSASAEIRMEDSLAAADEAIPIPVEIAPRLEDMIR